MKRGLYRENDYSFGQTMLTLRSTIGVTQAGLAEMLGVSRQSVAEWEAGSKYPKAKHLQAFVALAVQHQAFPSGGEADVIRELWKASRQKVLLDEGWLAQLLLPQPDKPHAASTIGARFHWQDALAVDTFYGRAWELNLITEWINQRQCRVVTLLGFGGIGKSALAVHLMYQVAEDFEVVIWRSLRDLPTCDELLISVLQPLVPQALGEISDSFEQRLNLFMEQLRASRVLVVLDNVESVLEEGESSGRMRPGSEDFVRFLAQVATTRHQSTILLTSRQKPDALLPHEGSTAPVRTLRLSALDTDSCEQLLVEKQVVGDAAERLRLIQSYAGNPLALKIVAQTIVDLFDGQIGLFLAQGELIFGGVRELLNSQFARLTPLEQSLLLWLAILREPATLDQLARFLVTPPTRMQLLEAMEALYRRSLIERGYIKGSFTLQSVVLEYATVQFTTEISAEIQSGRLYRLLVHGLELAQSPEYVRQTQRRQIVDPILENLGITLFHQLTLEKELLALVEQLREQPYAMQGYGPANLVALLRRLRGHLRGLDLSQLLLRSAYLQGVEMQDTTLVGAAIRDCVFTHTFNAILAIAVSASGAYWAASGRRGEVMVWTGQGQTLYRAWLAHTDMIWALSFSPDNRTLATGSWDGTVKLWDVEDGSLRWVGNDTNVIFSVAFSPDSRLLASCGANMVLRIRETQSGRLLQTLPHPVTLRTVTWHPDGQYLATGDRKGTIRLWQIAQEPTGNVSAVCVQTFTGHTNYIDGLAFAADGHTLASASWDGTVKLWDISAVLTNAPSTGETSMRLLQTLTGHTDWAMRVAWSPDGRILASSSRDQTTRLWDVEQGTHRLILQGHNALITGLAFTPDEPILLTGSEDGTLRMWDVVSGQCIHEIYGHAVSIYDVGWSPDGTQVACGSTDYLVAVYSLNGAPPQLLSGHSGYVIAIDWRPGNFPGQHWLASSEWDNLIRLWDPISGICLHTLEHPNAKSNRFYSLAWSPDGQFLAAGTSDSGVMVWDMTANRLLWAGQPIPSLIRQVAWQPDSTLVAGLSSDATTYVWDATNGALLQQLRGQHYLAKCLAWSADGAYLASGGKGSEGGDFFVWDVQRAERVKSFEGNPADISSLAWAPPGVGKHILISGDADGILRWWDTESGECLRVRQAHEGTVRSIRRSPDGTKLVSCGDDGAIVLWDLHSGEYLQTLRRDRPYERLNITGIKGLTEAQKATLLALGAIEKGVA